LDIDEDVPNAEVPAITEDDVGVAPAAADGCKPLETDARFGAPAGGDSIAKGPGKGGLDPGTLCSSDRVPLGDGTDVEGATIEAGGTSLNGEMIEAGRSAELGRFSAPVRCLKGRKTCSNEEEADGEGDGDAEDGEADRGISRPTSGFGEPPVPPDDGDAPELYG
jgi:hypothetical protein